MDNILISCITPTFNRAELLKKAIESTLAQTYHNWELIIIDDGSSDNTEAIVKSYINKDPRIKYYKNPGKGASAARNFGILKAKGEYLVFLDDDDEHLPFRFEKQLKAIEVSKSNFILSGYQVKNNDGKILLTHNNKSKAKAAGIGIRWIIKKDLVIKAGLFDEVMPSMQEVELSYRISKYEIYKIHREVVVTAYSTPNSISKGLNGLLGIEMLLKKHEYLMHPIEAAWWYFGLGIGYMQQNHISKSMHYFKISSTLDTRSVFFIGYHMAKYFSSIHLNKKTQTFILNKMRNFNFPTIIEHPVINEK